MDSDGFVSIMLPTPIPAAVPTSSLQVALTSAFIPDLYNQTPSYTLMMQGLSGTRVSQRGFQPYLAHFIQRPKAMTHLEVASFTWLTIKDEEDFIRATFWIEDDRGQRAHCAPEKEFTFLLRWRLLLANDADSGDLSSPATPT